MTTTAVVYQRHERAVFVGSVAPAATSADLKRFFAFCGEIEAIALRDASTLEAIPEDQASGQNSDLEAFVVFRSLASRDTALLLNNAIICGTAINVAVPSEADVLAFFHGQAGAQSTGDVDDGVTTAPMREQLAEAARKESNPRLAWGSEEPNARNAESQSEPQGGAQNAESQSEPQGDAQNESSSDPQDGDEPTTGSAGATEEEAVAVAEDTSLQPDTKNESVEAGSDALVPINQSNDELSELRASTLARIAAAGYILGEDAAIKAKELDQSHGNRVATLSEQSSNYVKGVDDRYFISIRAKAIGTIAKDRAAAAAAAADEKFALSQKAQTVRENATVQSGLSKFGQLKAAAAERAASLKRETSVVIEEKRAQREARRQTAQPALEDGSADQ